MSARAVFVAMLALLALAAAPAALAQGVAKPVDENGLKEILIWNSPWEGRAMTPPGLYSYRHVFRQRRDVLIAEVTSLSTNQRSASVVYFREGALNWQDSNGAEVNVALGASGELIGAARSREADLPITLKPRP